MNDEKIRKEAEQRTYQFSTILRGFVAPEDYPKAALLIKETKDRCIRDGVPLNDMKQVRKVMQEDVSELVGVSYVIFRDMYFEILSPLFTIEHEPDWEHLISKTMEYRYASFTSPLYEKFAEKCSEASGSVLIPEAEKFMPNLQRLIDDNPDCDYTLLTAELWMSYVIRRIFKDYQNVKVLCRNIYSEDLNGKYDWIFAVPNFGTRSLAQNSDFMTREQETVAFENLLLHLKSNGVLIIIVPARVTFAQGSTADFRNFVQQNHRIEEITELPEGVFSGTGIKTYLIDVKNARPSEDDAVTIRRYKAVGKSRREIEKLELEEDTFVMYGELNEMSDWNINRIFCQQDEQWQRLQNTSVTFYALGDIAEVFRGKAIITKNPTGKIGVVNISNIGDYEIDYDSLDHIDEEERKVSNYILHSGDVLLPARGTAIRTAVFTEKNYPCIASSNMIVIRPDTRRLNPVYLKLFFDSPLGAKLVSGAQQGSSIMNISYNDFKALEIPVPPIEEQIVKVARYEAEYKTYKQTIEAATSRWNSVLEELWNE